jgi:hypothetical protein
MLDFSGVNIISSGGTEFFPHKSAINHYSGFHIYLQK